MTSLFYPDYWDTAKTELSASDPVMARLIGQFPDARLSSRRDPFFTLARAIVGQQVSVHAADSMWHKLTALLHEMKSAPLLRQPDDALRSTGLSRQKIRYLRNIAAFHQEGKLEHDMLCTMEDDALHAHLTAITGVGNWTAEMFQIFCMNHPNILPLGDIGVLRAIRNEYGEEKLVHIKAERSCDDHPKHGQLYSCWHPWNTVAAWYLWCSIDPSVVEY